MLGRRGRGCWICCEEGGFGRGLVWYGGVEMTGGSRRVLVIEMAAYEGDGLAGYCQEEPGR